MRNAIRAALIVAVALWSGACATAGAPTSTTPTNGAPVTSSPSVMKAPAPSNTQPSQASEKSKALETKGIGPDLNTNYK